MTMNNDGGNQALVGYNPEKPGSRYPHWGKTDKIVHFRHAGAVSSDIFIMDANGENLKRLTSDDRTDQEPKLSPNGLHIVYTSQDHTKGGDARPSFYMIDASGANIRMLARPGIHGDWSPDGKTIVYTQSSGDNGRLWLMSPDGSGKRQLTFKNQF